MNPPKFGLSARCRREPRLPEQAQQQAMPIEVTTPHNLLAAPFDNGSPLIINTPLYRGILVADMPKCRGTLRLLR